MKVFTKTLKWIAKSIGLLLVLIILAGLIFRIFGPEPNKPLGKLVDIEGVKFHINSTGEKNNKPTLVIEGGLGMATEYYHWLSEGLKDSIRVIRYDRAGIGYSDVNDTPRDPETIAHELHKLLEMAGESPPYIMAGHSLGGPYIRIFTELYPNEVVAMFLLDTTHPDRVERIKSIPSESSFKWKSMIWLHDFQAILADLGIMMLYDKLMGPISIRVMEGLPEEINHRTIDFLHDGKYFRTMGREYEYYHSTLERAGEKNEFGSLPVRVFTDAISEIPEDVYQKYLKKGINLRKSKEESMKMQEELTGLSTNGKLTLMEGNHTSIFTKKENADIFCNEVLDVLAELEK